MPALLAFLHHVAAFSFVAALVLEFVLIKDELSVGTARKLLVVDLVAGVSAGVVLVAGLLRVFTRLMAKGIGYLGEVAS